jgi:hypothetical protein
MKVVHRETARWFQEPRKAHKPSESKMLSGKEIKWQIHGHRQQSDLIRLLLLFQPKVCRLKLYKSKNPLFFLLNLRVKHISECCFVIGILSSAFVLKCYFELTLPKLSRLGPRVTSEVKGRFRKMTREASSRSMSDNDSKDEIAKPNVSTTEVITTPRCLIRTYEITSNRKLWSASTAILFFTYVHRNDWNIWNGWRERAERE